MIPQFTPAAHLSAEESEAIPQLTFDDLVRLEASTRAATTRFSVIEPPEAVHPTQGNAGLGMGTERPQG